MRLILTLVIYGALAWLAALAWFIAHIPTTPLDQNAHAEAIVVLTGGQGRVEHGLSMLAAGTAPVLFISGVGEHTTEAQILETNADQKTREKIYETGGEIVLDHVARSTVANADQSGEFIRKRGIHSIRLITANYHMKRALHEFRETNRGLTILPDPVFPEGFQLNEWWQHDNTRRLLFSEFYKYIAVVLRDAIRPDETHE